MEKSLLSEKGFINVAIVFIVAFIFSIIAYFEKNIENITRDNRVKMYIRGILHSLIGATLGVAIYQVLGEFYKEFSNLTLFAISIFGATMFDFFILFLRRYIDTYKASNSFDKIDDRFDNLGGYR